MTPEEMRAIVREEMRPVELKLTLMASVIHELCRQFDKWNTTFTSPSGAKPDNFISDVAQASGQTAITTVREFGRKV